MDRPGRRPPTFLSYSWPDAFRQIRMTPRSWTPGPGGSRWVGVPDDVFGMVTMSHLLSPCGARYDYDLHMFERKPHANLTDWTHKLPAGAIGGTGGASFPMVLLHELGHFVGLHHDNRSLTLMNSSYPSGGDVSKELTPHENEYRAFRALYPDSSEGVNLMLSKFTVLSPGQSTESWGPSWPQGGQEGCPGDTIPFLSAEKVFVHQTGTSAPWTVIHRPWRTQAPSRPRLRRGRWTRSTGAVISAFSGWTAASGPVITLPAGGWHGGGSDP